MEKHIYIIGSGAIGKALAVVLKLQGRQVTLLRGSIDDCSSNTIPISVEMAKDTTLQAELDISTLQCFNKLQGIIVIASKSYSNSQLAESLYYKARNSPIVLLQNGLGIETPFIEKGYKKLYRSVLFATSQTTRPMSVRFKLVKTSPVGIELGDENELKEVVAYLSTPTFPFYATPDLERLKWKKAIVNCVFNSICPLLETDNGIFYRNGTALSIARRVIMECHGLALEKGIELSRQEIEKSLLEISRLSDGQEISTLQDIRNKRKTEMHALNSEIAKIAAQLGLDHMVSETRLLGELVELKSELNI